MNVPQILALVFVGLVTVGGALWIWAGMKYRSGAGKSRMAVAFGVVSIVAYFVASSVAQFETIAAFIAWVALTSNLAPMSSVLLQLIKRLNPGLENAKAMALSIVFSCMGCLVANIAQPYVADLPPIVNVIWPILWWALQQFWYSWAPEGYVITRGF